MPSRSSRADRAWRPRPPPRKRPDAVLTPVDDVARAFADAVIDAFASRPGPRFALVLSGGPTARECYEVLAGAGGMDWSLVDRYVGEERIVPPDDEDANQR